MNAAFPDALVQGWKHLVSDMDNDPGDRHVAAVAVAAEADAIVTLNARDFRGAVLASHGIRILTPAELVTHCLDDLPERVLHAVSEIRAGFVLDRGGIPPRSSTKPRPTPRAAAPPAHDSSGRGEAPLALG